MGTIELREGALEHAVKALPAETPVSMLNLLRFRDAALYPDGESGISGREAYARYSRDAIRHVSAIGGDVIMHAVAHAALIAPIGEEWDAILLVRYPSIARFVEMVSDPEYRRIAVHREAALADSRLIALTTPHA